MSASLADGPSPHPWEPEETVGALWHRFVTGLATEPHYPQAAATLASMAPRIGLMFRALGGPPGVEIVEAAPEPVDRRRGLARRLAHAQEVASVASFDGETLRLPPAIDHFPLGELNDALFLWLAAWAALDGEEPQRAEDAFVDDMLRLRHSVRMTARVLEACPGLQGIHERLRTAVLAGRRTPALSGLEARVEATVRRLLGEGAAVDSADDSLAAFVEGRCGRSLLPEASRDQLPFAPVPLWLDRRPAPQREATGRREDSGAQGGRAAEGGRRKAAKRRKSDQAERRDSLILHRFEPFPSWADFLNLNRRVEDDDEASARKAADDAGEMGLTQIDRSPATKLAFDLDLAPSDIDRERLSGERTYPEWDWKRSTYLADHVRVLAADAPAPEHPAPPLSPQTARRLRAVRRQFEALRPRRRLLTRQADGDDIDIDAVVESLVEWRASGRGSERLYRRIANQERDLAVATLIDVSRSTESMVDERPVIDIARESLLALGHGIAATGDAHAIHAFSSLRRDRVFVTRLKGFDEAMSDAVDARIAALKPGFYTRLGAAIRHVSTELAARPATRRLLLVLTDGKPNDLDHYEGRHGVEDSRRAVMESRRLGQSVFAITIDRKAQAWIPHIFGTGGFAIVPRPARLVEALPQIWRHIAT